MDAAKQPVLLWAMDPQLRRLRHRGLKGIMFAQLVAVGAVSPILSRYLQDFLHFDGLLTGSIMAISTVAAITTPMVVVFVADRLVSSRVLLGICHLLSAAGNLALVFARQPAQVLLAWLLVSISQGPVFGLANTLAFHHLEDQAQDYGGVRVWGTLGWMAAGWLLSLAWMLVPVFVPGQDPDTAMPLIFVIAVIGSVVTAIISFRLPLADSRIGSRDTPGSLAELFFPKEALKTLASPLMLLLVFMYFGAGVMDKTFYFGAGPYLPDLGFPKDSVMAILTIGQLVEILMLVFLGTLLRRVGYGAGFILGMVAQVGRSALMAVPHPAAALAGIALHGVVVGFLHMGIIMKVNSHCQGPARSGINQIMVLAMVGLASLVGNLGAGAVLKALRSWVGEGSPGAWTWFWILSASLGLVFLGIQLIAWPLVNRAERARAPGGPVQD